jgi:hypothetical protein
MARTQEGTNPRALLRAVRDGQRSVPDNALFLMGQVQQDLRQARERVKKVLEQKAADDASKPADERVLRGLDVPGLLGDLRQFRSPDEDDEIKALVASWVDELDAAGVFADVTRIVEDTILLEALKTKLDE